MGFLIAFFAGSPFNFIDPLGFDNTFMNPLRKLIDLDGEATKSSLRFVGVEVERFVLIRSLGHYFTVLTSMKGMGVIGIVSIVGMLMLFVKSSMKNIILLSFPVLFIFIANKMNPFYSSPRHLNAIYPFMALFAAYLINFFFERFQNKKRVEWLVFAIFILIIVMPVYRIAKHDYLMTRPDTRTVAKEWIEANIPSGTKILIEESSVKISPDERYFKGMLERRNKFDAGQFTTHLETLYKYSLKALPEITYDITYIRFPWWKDKEEKEGVNYATSEHDKDMGNPLKPVGVMPYEFYQENGYKYIVVTSDMYKKFIKEDLELARKFPSFRKFYQRLFEKGLIVKEFSSNISGNRGPVIKIFKVI